MYSFTREAPTVKCDKFSKSHRPKIEFEKESIKQIPYGFAVGSLMYAQVCIDLALLMHQTHIGGFS